MPGCDIIVIGGSTGALEGLRVMAAGLPAGLEASLFVAIHTTPDARGFLDDILSRTGPLPAAYAADGDAIEPGRFYLAPPDRHLLIARGRVQVRRGPRENGFRPAVNPLFRTAAGVYGARVAGVLLSGARDDGVAGLAAIKREGGVALVQDPSEALAPGMPETALRNVEVDHVAGAADMADIVRELVTGAHRSAHGTPMGHDRSRDAAEAGTHDIHRARRTKPPSPFTCPECGGALWQSGGDGPMEFRCHVGHRYTGDGLASAQLEALEHVLWSALRTLEEGSELSRRMARRAREARLLELARAYEERARESEGRAAAIRRVLMPERSSTSGVV